MNLKELLKPPFTASGDIIEAETNDPDTDGKFTVFELSESFSFFHNLGDADKIELTQFAAHALNEKYEREFGEARWKKTRHEVEDAPSYNIFECEKCHEKEMKVSNFCPHCGTRLKPPEEEGNGN